MPLMSRLEARSPLASGASGECVTCSGTPKCPECGKDEECVMTTQTCDACPKTYCTKLTTTLNGQTKGLSSAKIGGIAGGAAAGALLVIGALMFLVYKRWYQKRKLSGRAGMGSGSGAGVDEGDPETSMYPGRRASQATTGQSSVLTRASNILNVAYIPGVKVRTGSASGSGSGAGSGSGSGLSGLSGSKSLRTPTTGPAGSIYSKETYMSDLENASFHAGQVASKGANPQLVSMTEEEYNYEMPEYDREREQIEGRLQTVNEEGEEEEALSPTSPKRKVGFGPLVLKHTTEPLASDSDEAEDEEDSDSDEENIEMLVAEAEAKEAKEAQQAQQTKAQQTNAQKSLAGTGTDSSSMVEIPLSVDVSSVVLPLTLDPTMMQQGTTEEAEAAEAADDPFSSPFD